MALTAALSGAASAVVPTGSTGGASISSAWLPWKFSNMEKARTASSGVG